MAVQTRRLLHTHLSQHTLLQRLYYALYVVSSDVICLLANKLNPQLLVLHVEVLLRSLQKKGILMHVLYSPRASSMLLRS